MEVRDGGRIEVKVEGDRLVRGVMQVEVGVRGGEVRAVDEGRGVYVPQKF